MNEIRAFIARHEDEVQVFLYAVLIISLWFAEIFLSKNTVKSKWKHLRSNYLFIFTGLPIQLFFTGFVILISAWDNRHHFGLINLVPHYTNPWVYYISLFLMLDLCEYTYHVVMHKTEFLWKFHLVHHSDLHVDVSTTVREHPCETVVRTCFLMLWVFICGPLLSVLVLRQTFQTFANILGHTEFRLPERVNRFTSLLFITPNLHHVHHHYQLPYTDRNYGDVLSIWDRLFGTYANLDKAQTHFGIDTHMDANINSKFGNILKIPFQKFERPGDQFHN
jgi:sterol desaturase/sphingolipid hydroxylase (fatty acid hydroxylase superfamily)